MENFQLQPSLHLQHRRRGGWTSCISRRDSLEAIQAQMTVIDEYRGKNWPQRITDDVGNILVQNDAARQLPHN